MTSPLEGAPLLWIWIGFLVLMLVGLGLVFIWAVRAGQFSDQERARYLALRSGIPSEKHVGSDGQVK